MKPDDQSEKNMCVYNHQLGIVSNKQTVVWVCFISLATTTASPSKWAKVLIDLANQRPIHLNGLLVSNFWVWKRDGSRNVKGELAPGLANFHNPPSNAAFAHGSFYSHSNSTPCMIYLPNVSMCGICGIFPECHEFSCFSKKKFRVSAEKRPRCFCNGWHPNMSRYLHALNFETKMIHKKWNTSIPITKPFFCVKKSITNHPTRTKKKNVQLRVSKNRGTPKSSILIGFSITNHPFWGIPIFGNTQFCGKLLKIFFFEIWTQNQGQSSFWDHRISDHIRSLKSSMLGGVSHSQMSHSWEMSLLQKQLLLRKQII